MQMILQAKLDDSLYLKFESTRMIKVGESHTGYTVYIETSRFQ